MQGKKSSFVFSAPLKLPSPRDSNGSLPRSCFGGAARLRSAALRGELCPGERERDEIWAGIAVIRE